MAGRKPTPKPDLLSTLLGKFGLAQPAKKGGKKKRRKAPARPAAGHDGYAAEGAAFSDYHQEPGLGFAGENAYEAGYEAAAAAGYAPTPAPPMEPLFPDAPPPMERPAALPTFGGPASAPPPAFNSAVGGSGANGLFNQDALDSSLDDLFAGLEMGTAPAASVPDNIHDSGRGVPASGGNIVAFPGGSLDAPPMPEPVAAGTGRLPLMPEPMEAAPAPAPVATKAPSRPLPVMPEAPTWDAGSPTPAAAVLTLSQGQDLRTLLATIDRTAGVSGSLLVGYDGLIIATTLPSGVDRDYLAAQACAMFSATNQQTERLERGELRRMVLETSTGAMLMTAADMGILVVVSDGPALETRAIAHAIAGALGQG